MVNDSSKGRLSTASNAAPRRGNKQIALGIALGNHRQGNTRPVRAKAFQSLTLLPLQGAYIDANVNPGRCPGLRAHWPCRPLGSIQNQ